MKASAEKAFADVRKDEMVICLSHHPDFFPFAADWGAPLTLAGHTHGGQIALFGRPLLTTFAHMLGWYKRGEPHLYVSGGFGQWLPFRLVVSSRLRLLHYGRSEIAEDGCYLHFNHLGQTNISSKRKGP